MKDKAENDLKEFIDQWQETANKTTFLRFKNYLAEKDGVTLNFIPRPGLTYSLRAAKENQSDRDLFVMVDVIEAEPRWLSICFYGEMITDPAEKGDFVPQGLLGNDAICFDLEESNDELICYIEARMDEAWRN